MSGGMNLATIRGLEPVPDVPGKVGGVMFGAHFEDVCDHCPAVGWLFEACDSLNGRMDPPAKQQTPPLSEATLDVVFEAYEAIKGGGVVVVDGKVCPEPTAKHRFIGERTCHAEFIVAYTPIKDPEPESFPDAQEVYFEE